MEVVSLPSGEIFQGEVVSSQLEDKNDLSLMFGDETVNQLLEHSTMIFPNTLLSTVGLKCIFRLILKELGTIRWALKLAESLASKEETITKAKKEESLLSAQESDLFKDQLGSNSSKEEKIDLDKVETESPQRANRSEMKQDPKLRSNSFYGRRDTLLKTVRKFRNDFPECDAMVFGNWRTQDNQTRFWPKDLTEFGQKQAETILNFLDSRYKFPCDESVWDRYKTDTTDTRRAKLSKKRKMFERKVSQLAALGNNDIFFLLMYPTKEYKEINTVCHCWVDNKVVTKPFSIIANFLKRLDEFKTNQVYHLTTNPSFKQDLHLEDKQEERMEEGELNVAIDLVEPTAIVLERLASQMNTPPPPPSHHHHSSLPPPPPPSLPSHELHSTTVGTIIKPPPEKRAKKEINQE